MFYFLSVSLWIDEEVMVSTYSMFESFIGIIVLKILQLDYIISLLLAIHVKLTCMPNFVVIRCYLLINTI